MDLTNAFQPKTDQLNADDLIGGPITVTITRVTPGSDEQPVNVHFAEFPRPWRPSKGMGRVLKELWGNEGDDYVGRRISLYREPRVRFGKDTVGGVRVSHMSDIGDKARTVIVTTTRGQRAPFTVKPLAHDAPSSESTSEADLLRAEWMTATPERRKEIEALAKPAEQTAEDAFEEQS